MGFLKYANAGVVKPAISMAGWDDVRTKALTLGSAFDSRKARGLGVDRSDDRAVGEKVLRRVVLLEDDLRRLTRLEGRVRKHRPRANVDPLSLVDRRLNDGGPGVLRETHQTPPNQSCGSPFGPSTEVGSMR